MRTAPTAISEPRQSPSAIIGRHTLMGDLSPFPGFRAPATGSEARRSERVARATGPLASCGKAAAGGRTGADAAAARRGDAVAVTLQRRTLVFVLSGVAVAAAAIAVTLVLVSRGGGSSTTTAPVQTATRSALLVGIPQSGLELGNPSAPALYEYADIQCPYCAEFSNHVLPTVIREYVRTGKVKLVFHGLAFIGPDSTKALRAVQAAGLQNRLWDVLDGVYARQGQENSGWVTDDLLKEVGGGVSGLDTGRWLDEAGSDAVTSRISEAARAATSAGVDSTPSFVFKDRLLHLQSLDPADFKAALEPLLS